MRIRIVLSLSLVLAVVCLAAFGCSGQQADQTSATPQSAADEKDPAVRIVIEKSNDALRSLDFAAYAAVMHPQALTDYRDMLLPQVQRMLVTSGSDSITLFGTMVDGAALSEESSAEFFADMMKQIFTMSEQLRSTFEGMKTEYIGTVYESDSVAHGVVRTTMMIGGIDRSEITTVTARLQDGEWMIMLSNHIGGVAGLMQQMLMQMG